MKGVAPLALAVSVALLAGCSDSSVSAKGRGEAHRACSVLDQAYERAAARADRLNEGAEELAHPAHVGDDGFEPVEWELFERADDMAAKAAAANSDFAPLSASLTKLLSGKGSGGVAAASALGGPIQAAFDECYDSGLLARPE